LLLGMLDKFAHGWLAHSEHASGAGDGPCLQNGVARFYVAQLHDRGPPTYNF
jgi:hypothetical protein